MNMYPLFSLEIFKAPSKIYISLFFKYTYNFLDYILNVNSSLRACELRITCARYIYIYCVNSLA